MKRALLLVLALLALGVPVAAQSTAGGELVYFGTRSGGPGQGIFGARLDTATGKLTGLGLMAELDHASWLWHRRGTAFFYAVGENNVGVVHALRADPDGHLQVLNTVSSEGSTPAFLSVDGPSNTVLVANYGSGHVAALPILADGSLGPAASVQANTGSGPLPRQKGPHAHSILVDPSGRFALSADLGADRLFVYRFDRARRQLTPADPPFEVLPPGTGPRHIVFDSQGRFLYLISEINPQLRVYRWDGARGRLQLQQTLSSVADGAATTTAAEIAFSPDGKFLYASNRGENSIAAFAVDPATGLLSERQRISAGGTVPWGFAIDPSGRWLLVANEGSGSIAVLKRDLATGTLSATGESLAVPMPDDVAFSGD